MADRRRDAGGGDGEAAVEVELGPTQTRELAATLVSAVAARGPRGRWLTAVLGTATALAGRFAVHEAGKRSSLDPRAAFEG